MHILEIKSKRRLLNRLSIDDLVVFIHRVFLEVDRSQPYCPNWHIRLIAEELMQLYEGKKRRLIINLPPRSLKSLCVSVAFPAWILGHDPTARIICISYNQKLAEKFGRQTRQVMESIWYRKLFPHTRISVNKCSNDEFETTACGCRIATSIGGKLTGFGGKFLIIDDPIKPDDALSKIQRDTVNEWFSSNLYSRQDNKNESRIVIVMQRVHEEDLVAHVQTMEPWHVIKLRAIAEEDEEYILRNGIYVRRKGEVLNKHLDTPEGLASMRKGLTPFYFESQYQQNPIPETGNIINFDWFCRYAALPEISKKSRIVQSWDTAMTEHDGSDYSACITVLIHEKQYYILDVYRANLNFPDLIKKVKALKLKYTPKAIYIENKASGTPLLQMLKREGITAIGIDPVGTKEDRIASQSAIIEAGRVYIPENASWIEEFKHEVNGFPRGTNDDQIDALSQLLKREEETGSKLDWLKNIG